jgi:hypothetical protein
VGGRLRGVWETRLPVADSSRPARVTHRDHGFSYLKRRHSLAPATDATHLVLRSQPTMRCDIDLSTGALNLPPERDLSIHSYHSSPHSITDRPAPSTIPPHESAPSRRHGPRLPGPFAAPAAPPYRPGMPVILPPDDAGGLPIPGCPRRAEGPPSPPAPDRLPMPEPPPVPEGALPPDIPPELGRLPTPGMPLIPEDPDVPPGMPDVPLMPDRGDRDPDMPPMPGIRGCTPRPATPRGRVAGVPDIPLPPSIGPGFARSPGATGPFSPEPPRLGVPAERPPMLDIPPCWAHAGETMSSIRPSRRIGDRHQACRISPPVTSSPASKRRHAPGCCRMPPWRGSSS